MDEELAILRALNQCQVCGTKIDTMAFRGTGSCGTNHFKELYGEDAKYSNAPWSMFWDEKGRGKLNHG